MKNLSQFHVDNQGNVAMIFAILFLPLLMFVGVAIDYSRIANHESELQTVVDNAATSIVNLSSKRISAARQIENMINANSGRDTAEVKINIRRDKLRIEARDQIDTPLLSTIGQGTSEITASIELDANRGSGTPGSRGIPEIDKKQFNKAIEKQLNEALKQVGLGGNLNRLSPTQRARMQRQLENRMKRMGVRFK